MDTKHIIKKKIKIPIFRSIVSLMIIGFYIWFLIIVDPDLNYKILAHLNLGFVFPLLIGFIQFGLWINYDVEYKNVIVHKIVDNKK